MYIFHEMIYKNRKDDLTMKKLFKNICKKHIAQITLALAITLGGAFNADAASLDKAVFGQTAEQTVAQSTTAKPANLVCFKDKEFMFTDTNVDSFMNTEIDVVKYAFLNNALYSVEVNFKNSSMNGYTKLLESMKAKYGTGEEKATYNKHTGDAEVSCSWELQGKRMILSYMRNTDFQFNNLYLIALAAEPGVSVTGK